jgi:antitoxin YefM
MTNTNITNLRKHLFEYVNQAIEYNDVINVNTKSGNAIIMSEEEYNGLIETLFLSSNPKVKEDIVKGINTPLEECVSADEVEW